jgi:hypothetical protein
MEGLTSLSECLSRRRAEKPGAHLISKTVLLLYLSQQNGFVNDLFSFLKR